jgi:hypothetical protein
MYGEDRRVWLEYNSVQQQLHGYCMCVQGRCVFEMDCYYVLLLLRCAQHNRLLPCINSTCLFRTRAHYRG